MDLKPKNPVVNTGGDMFGGFLSSIQKSIFGDDERTLSPQKVEVRNEKKFEEKTSAQKAKVEQKPESEDDFFSNFTSFKPPAKTSVKEETKTPEKKQTLTFTIPKQVEHIQSPQKPIASISDDFFDSLIT